MAFREIYDDLWRIVLKYFLPSKPHIGRSQCDPHWLFNGILYILTTGCTWHNVLANYGIKLTVYRYHLEFCEKRVYPVIFLELSVLGTRSKRSVSRTV